MATQLFLLDAVSDTHLGTDNTNLLGTAVGWTSKALGTARGSGVIASDNVATVTGATAGITVTKTSAVEWISPPVAADVTISGTITVNVWAAESSMTANVAINARVFVIRGNATATRNSNTLDTIATTAFTTELALTTRAANNFTVTPTSTAVSRGDRLRVILYGDDSVAATMATGFTFNASWNGTAGAADGDSYVTFTETITFEAAAPGVLDQTDASGGSLNFGNTGAAQQFAQAFVAQGNLTEVRVTIGKGGTPTDDVVIEIQTNAAGSPSGSVVGTVATVNNSALTTTLTQYTYSCSITLTASSTYWLVLRRSGSLDNVNLYKWAMSSAAVSGWTNARAYNGSSWTDQFVAAVARFAMPGSTLYLTDTASAVATASVDREAWTSRGSGVVNDVTNTAAGWTAPIQVSDTAGGTVVDWFTRPLTAFTLGGMAVANLRALESNALANSSIRCEIARVANDGTSPTVWASWNVAPTSTDNGELTTSEVARTANVSGDDLAITDGQRLRIRVYIDDMSSAAMAASQTVTFYYAGTSAAASGDSYITFPQTLTEYTAPSGPPVIPVGFAVGRDY